jgi:hypothetical protein
MPGVSLALILALCTAACEPAAQYQSFAEAGSLYAKALDRLLDTAGDIAIDATSTRLLQDDALVNQTPESYRRLADTDIERIRILGLLRRHAQLMGRYFSLLNDLATTNAPERTQKALAGTLNAVNSLGSQLRSQKLISNVNPITLGASAVVNAKIRSRLREEFESRGKAVQEELATQEVLLKALGDSIRQDLKIVRQARELSLVVQPLVSDKPVGNPDRWMADRRAVIKQDLTADALDAASVAIAKLRDAYEDIVNGRFDASRRDALLTDFETVLSLAESVHAR